MNIGRAIFVAMKDIAVCLTIAAVYMILAFFSLSYAATLLWEPIILIPAFITVVFVAAAYQVCMDAMHLLSITFIMMLKPEAVIFQKSVRVEESEETSEEEGKSK